MTKDKIAELENDETYTADATVVKTVEKEWTIMVYMAGDNNLSDEMIRAVNDLRKKIDLVGQTISNTSSPYKRNGVGFLVEFDGEHPVVPSRRYNLTFDTNDPGGYSNTSRPSDIDSVPKTPIVMSPGSEPIGTTERQIADFIDYCMLNQPAKHYALILSGHSDAFLGQTLLIDQDPSGIATIRGIKQVIGEKFKSHGKLEILGFDGCVMNMLEVVYEFREDVRTWIGSQGSIPNYTWDYARIAEQLMDFDENYLSDEKIADAILTAVKDYNCPYAFGGRSVDISCLDVSKIEAFSKEIAFAGILMFFLLKIYGPKTLIGSKILQILLQAHWNCQTAMHNQSVDLIDYLSRVRIECVKILRQEKRLDPELPDGNVNETELSDQDLMALLKQADPENPGLTAIFALIHLGCSKLLNSIRGLVKSGIFVGADYRFCNGVSVFLPWSFVALWMSRREYKKLEFTSDNSGWYTFLMAYTASSARPPMPIAPLPELTNALQVLINILSQQMPTASPDKSNDGTDFLKVFTLGFIDTLIVRPFNDTKDNPPYNRGFELYEYHFAKTNNIKPELDINGEFPPRKELGPCPF